MGELMAYRESLVHVHLYVLLTDHIETCRCGSARWVTFDLPMLSDSRTTEPAKAHPHAS